MTRKIIFIFAVLCSLQLRVNAQSTETGNAAYTTVVDDNGLLQPMQPAYLDGVITSPPWNGNWYITLSGGAAAFLGTPLGCNDLFGRIRPTYDVAVGKWFTPAIGVRVDYQGMWLRNSENASQNYHYVHADLMWNLLGKKYGRQKQVRWNLSPFLGVGLIHNATRSSNSFAFSYGLQGEYNISHRVSFVMGLSGMTTFQDFDGHGKANRFGDNMLTLTAGFSFRLGKIGWKRIADANPYIRQNDWLIDYANTLVESNRRYASQHEKNTRTLVELKKILEIEGLLDMCRHLFENGNAEYAIFPRNDYSGLNSLRARLNNKHWDGKSPLIDKDTAKNNNWGKGRNDVDSNDEDESADKKPTGNKIFSKQFDNVDEAGDMDTAFSDSESIGSPIYFFFTIGTNRLTDTSQLVNIDELARVAKKYGLTITVAGAADSATGTPDINNMLSSARAEYIVAELLKRGIPMEMIYAVNSGGIATYTPIEANRHTRVELHLPYNTERIAQP